MRQICEGKGYRGEMGPGGGKVIQRRGVIFREGGLFRTY